MAISTTYPGSYIEESSSLTVSVSIAPTAVPAFIIDPSEAEAPKVTTRFSSWLEFSQSRGEHIGYIYWNAIKAWFMLGGGACYLVPKNKALADIPKYDDITLLVAMAQNINDLVTQLCVPGRNLFALLDGPDSQIANDAKPEDVMKDYPASANAAVWYPWLNYPWKTSSRYLPPSVVAAAAIANTDRTRGVWKSPVNFTVNFFEPRYPVSDELQGTFNSGKALNMIRTFAETGATVWGARTLEDSDNWRYIAVRRLFNSVENDIRTALQQFVFEPNTPVTWHKAKNSIDNYLYQLWEKGGLAGSKPEDAWFTDIARDSTMTQDDIDQGKMVAHIGIAAVRPAEFIVLQISQNIVQK